MEKLHNLNLLMDSCDKQYVEDEINFSNIPNPCKDSVAVIRRRMNAASTAEKADVSSCSSSVFASVALREASFLMNHCKGRIDWIKQTGHLSALPAQHPHPPVRCLQP